SSTFLQSVNADVNIRGIEDVTVLCDDNTGRNEDGWGIFGRFKPDGEPSSDDFPLACRRVNSRDPFGSDFGNYKSPVASNVEPFRGGQIVDDDGLFPGLNVHACNSAAEIFAYIDRVFVA